MFFKKKDETVKQNSAPPAEIKTIPEIFYGGSDPQVYHASGALNTSQSKMVGSASTTPGSKKWLVGILFCVVFLGVAALGGWYLWQQYFPASPKLPVVKNPASIVPPPITEATSTPIVAVEATSTVEFVSTTLPISVTSTPTKIAAEPNFDFPPIIQIDAADLDADSFTDAEEEIFGTDPSAFDTDGDSYYDGQEFFNLYNPKGTSPVKLIDSGLVQEYSAPVAKYRVYYPAAWQLGTVDPSGNQVLMSATNGDYVEVRLSDKQPGEDFNAWFGRVASGERITELQSVVNRFSSAFFKRKDDLVAYFDSPTTVYIIIYHPKTAAPLLYRHTMQMMTQSFRLPGANTIFNAVEQTPILTSAVSTLSSPSSSLSN